ncbi:MAG: carbohydrate kinase family protein [Caldilineaceae bacterium]|nr:carbohydrate kinase family protein [Caldilineaceae bacterium]
MFLIFGTTTLDLFNSGITQMPRFQGDEFTVDSLAFCDQPLRMSLGGNGAVTSHVLGKLGASVALCSAIGKDQPGDILSDWLTQGGVELRGLMRFEDAATSTTTVISDQALNRVAFHHAGASHVYSPAHFPAELLDQATAVLFSSLTLFPEWRTAGITELMTRAKRNGALTALDIGPAIGQPILLAELADLLPYIDYFICNQHELTICTGEEASDSGLVRAMRSVLNAGSGCVVVKRGKQGVTLWRTIDPKAYDVDTLIVDAVSTVGAGDSFNAGFLLKMRQGQNIVDAAFFGNAVASLVISQPNGPLGAPTLAHVEAITRS